MANIKKTFKRTLLTKFIIISLVILLAAGGLALTSVLISKDFSKALVTLVKRDLAVIEQNANLSRSLNNVLLKTHLILKKFITNDAIDRKECQLLQNTLKKNKATASKSGNTEMVSILSNFDVTLESVLKNCRIIVNQSCQLKQTAEILNQQLLVLEQRVTDVLIERKLKRQQFELFSVEQLSSAIPDYKLHLIQVQMELFTIKQKALDIHTANSLEIDTITQKLDQLKTDVNAITTAGKEFRPIYQKIVIGIETYQKQIKQFHQSLCRFQRRQVQLNDISQQGLTKLKGVDRQVSYTASNMQDIIKQKGVMAEHFTVILASIVVTILISLIFLFCYRVIIPIANLSRRVQEIMTHFGFSESTTLEGDEIERFSKSFESMANELKSKTVSVEVLKREQQRFHDISETTGDWIWETDSTGQFKYVNSVVEKVLDYKQTELQETSIFDLLVDGSNSNKELFQELITNKEPYFDFHIECRRKNGETAILESTGIPILDHNGTFIGYRGVNRDVTEQQQVEKKMHELNRQLQESSRAAGKSEIATGILHNVGNILNSVNVSANVINEKIYHLKTENVSNISTMLKKKWDGMEVIEINSKTLNDIILYISKIGEHLSEQKQAVLQELKRLEQNIKHIKDIIMMQQNYAHVAGVMEIVKPADIINDSIRLIERSLKRNGVTLAREFDDVPGTLTDRHKVLQILMNLLHNARQAMTNNGPRERLITVRLFMRDQATITISVEDSGEGIDEGRLLKIFTYGFTTKEDGNGFGLHISALSAKELGGELRASSDGPGKGACFSLDLPLQSEAG